MIDLHLLTFINEVKFWKLCRESPLLLLKLFNDQYVQGLSLSSNVESKLRVSKLLRDRKLSIWIFVG